LGVEVGVAPTHAHPPTTVAVAAINHLADDPPSAGLGSASN
jgi:hypothetical protein